MQLDQKIISFMVREEYVQNQRKSVQYLFWQYVLYQYIFKPILISLNIPAFPCKEHQRT